MYADVDDGTREGVTNVEQAELNRLKAELREVVAILRAATTFFAGELDPEAVDAGLRRHDQS